MIKMIVEKNVYFARHGESADNVNQVFQSPESPLTERGREQARLIGERAQKITFDTLISSPFARAKETAAIISNVVNKEIEYSDLFVERMRPKIISGKPKDDPEASRIAKAWKESLFNPKLRVEGGENFQDIVARADTALDFLLKRPEKNLFVVTHGFFLQVMIARVLLGDKLTGEALKSLQSGMAMKNTGLSVLQYSARPTEENLHWRLWVYNDHEHLAEI